MYLIRRASDRDAFLKAPDLYPSFRIETCPWGGEYRPETSFSAAHSDGAKKIPPRAHIALAAHENNEGAKILRRSYNYTDGLNQYGQLDAGLLFLSVAVFFLWKSMNNQLKKVTFDEVPVDPEPDGVDGSAAAAAAGAAAGAVESALGGKDTDEPLGNGGVTVPAERAKLFAVELVKMPLNQRPSRVHQCSFFGAAAGGGEASLPDCDAGASSEAYLAASSS